MWVKIIVMKYIDIVLKKEYNLIRKRFEEVMMKAITTDKEKTNINFRLDKNLKEELDILCDEIGITVTTAFTIFAKKFVRERRLPFTVDADPFYSAKNLERLKKSIEQLENKGGTVHEITEVLDD